MRSTSISRPLVLSGFMATGKTTAGRALAARREVPFVDADEGVPREAYLERHLSICTDDVAFAGVVDACDRPSPEDPLLVPLGARSYPVTFVRNTPNRLTDALAALGPSAIVVVTDSNVQRARHAW